MRTSNEETSTSNEETSLSTQHKTIWIIERPDSNGRLCNQLGLFAHFSAFCIERNDSLVNLNFSEYAKNFKYINSGLISFFPSKQINIPWNWATYYLCETGIFFLKKYPFSYCLQEELRINEVITKDNCFNLQKLEIEENQRYTKLFFCKGWRFRCYDLVDKHAETIRNIFQPSEAIESWILEKLNEVRQSNTMIVAVHMRLGDYRHHWHGRFNYSVDTYRNLMLSVKALFPDQYNIKFLIFSDEPQSLDLFEGFDAYLAEGTAPQDLYLMSKCDYIIGPPSSFSNWASFYGNVPLFHIQKDDIRPQLSDFDVYLPLDIPVS